MSFGAGMAAGIGAGIAIGISSGSKQARDKMGQYFASQGITLRDSYGEQVEIEDALDQALRCNTKCQKNLIVFLALGLLATALAGVAFYFLVLAG